MLAIGMPYELYWHGEKRAVDDYLNSVKYRNLIKNNDMHLQGVYVLKALQDVLQFKDYREIYPRKPLPLGEEKKPQTQAQVEMDMKAYLSARRAQNG